MPHFFANWTGGNVSRICLVSRPYLGRKFFSVPMCGRREKVWNITLGICMEAVPFRCVSLQKDGNF
jgi:hypothetical protein